MQKDFRWFSLGIVSIAIFAFLVGGVSFANAASKYKWEKYFTTEQGKTIQSQVGKNIRNNLSDGRGDWEEVIVGDAIRDNAIDTNKIKNGTILAEDLASNGCALGQILKYNGTAWACAGDDSSGSGEGGSSSLGDSVESSEITDGTILNADISNSAAIAYSKLNLGSSILKSDLASSGCASGQILKYNGTAWACSADESSGSSALGDTIESSEITDGTIADADIASDAAISYSKLNLNGTILASDLASSSCTSGQILKYDGTAWACSADESSGSSALGDTIESSEITDGTIVDADIASDASIDSDKINFSGKNVNLGGLGVYSSTNPGTDYATIDYNESGDALDFLINGTSSESSGFYFNNALNVNGSMQVGDSIDLSNTDSGKGKITFPGTRGGSIDAPSDPGLGVTIVDTVRINDVLQLNPISGAPFTCQSEVEGTVYYDSTDHKMKVCDGTTWTDLY